MLMMKRAGIVTRCRTIRQCFELALYAISLYLMFADWDTIHVASHNGIRIFLVNMVCWVFRPNDDVIRLCRRCQ